MLAFPVVLEVALATSPTTILFAGVPVGFLVGDASDGWPTGLRNRFLAGVAVLVPILTAGDGVVTAAKRAAPGIVKTLLVVALTAVALGVETALVAGVVGLGER